jgi:NADH dehydrogenase
MSRRSARPSLRRCQVAIVGANFAGMSAALALPPDCDVAVVDPHPWFEWLPNVHELVSGVKRPADLRLPRRQIIERAGHRFVRARVTGLDPRRRALRLDDGRQLTFEQCLLAFGGVNDDFGVPGASTYGMPFKSVAECAAIGTRLRRLASQAGRFSVVIVGGGFEGIEALGEVLRRYRDHPRIAIHLVERAERLLAEGPRAVDRAVRRHVAGLPVHLHCAERVARVMPRSVALASRRRIASDLTIWTGGARAPALARASGVARSAAGWVAVRRDLSCRGAAGLFAAGDDADLPRPIAKQAYHAIDMGRHAARNILRLRRGEKTLPFAPAPKPMLVACGDLDTFLITGSRVIASPALAAAKEAVFQVTIAEFDRLRSPAGLRRVVARATRALHELALPTLHSPGELMRLLALRIDDGSD